LRIKTPLFNQLITPTKCIFWLSFTQNWFDRIWVKI
jgi:hypothetical protein